MPIDDVPPLDEEHDDPICAKCGFDGWVVACVWKGEEGCQLTYPPPLEQEPADDR